MIVCPLAAESVAVNRKLVVPELPSACVTGPMLSEGRGSSFWIVTSTELGAADGGAAVGRRQVDVEISSASFVVSPLIATVMTALVAPGAKVSVPLVG